MYFHDYMPLIVFDEQPVVLAEFPGPSGPSDRRSLNRKPQGGALG